MDHEASEPLPGGQLEASGFAQAVVDVSAAPILVLDREGRIVRFNRACERLSGYRFEEVRGRPFFFLVPPEEVEGLREAYARMIAGEFPLFHENEWVRRDGTRRLVSWSNSALVDAEGRVLYVVATGIDVSEPRRFEAELERLREQERRRAEQRRLESAKLQAIIESMSQPLLIVDTRGRIVSMNRAALELHDVDGLEGRRVDPEGYEWLFESLDAEGRFLPLERWPVVRAMRGETVRDLELQVTNRLTGKRWVGLYSATPVRDERGEPILGVVTIQDITGLRRAAEERRASEERFRTLANNAPDLITRFDPGLRLLYANDAAARALLDPASRPAGHPRVEPGELGEPLPGLVPALESRVRQAFATGAPQRLEFEFEGRLGRRFYESRLVPERGPDGAVRSVLALSRDLTERRRGEQERERLLAEVGQLADRLERIQAATAALSAAATSREVAEVTLREGARAAPPVTSAVLVAEPEAGAPGELRALESFGEWTPEGRERWFGFRLQDLEPPLRAALEAGAPLWVEDRAELAARYPAVADAVLPKKMQALVLLPVAHEGRLVGAAGFAYASPRRFDRAERELLVTLAGLSAQALVRTRLYESEKSLRSAAEEETRLRERLMAVLGHDLRQPMSVISASVGSVLRHPEDLSERALSLLRRAARALSGMDALLWTLLDYSRLRAGQPLPLLRAPGDLCEWVRELVDDARVANPGRRIDLDCQGDLGGDWDRLRLGQVVGNLVSNAVKYGDPAGPVQVRALGRGEEILLEVANRGEPIPIEIQEEIFEPLRRARDEHAGSRGGMGLGLFIVREIARAHGGRVELRSSDAEGTVFAVRLPRRG